MGLGFVSKLTGFIPGDANKGIGPMVGKICLPLLIFRNVAKLDLSTVDWGVIGAAGVVKICSLLLAACVAYCTKPTTNVKAGDIASQYGIFTLFCTGSNDLAIGLAIINSIYPPATSPVDFGSLTFVIVGMQVSIFNIPSFILLEYGKGLRAASEKGGAVCPKKLFKLILSNLLKNPILLFTFLGLIYNGINPPVPGDKTSNKNIPYLIDEMMAKGGSAFGMSALFLGGMAVVGKFKLLRGRKLILPTVLSMIKILVAPIIGFYLTRAIFEGNPNQDIYAEYVFVYSSLPTAGSIIVFAQAYDVALKDLISGAAVLVLLLWSPIMYTAATLLVGGSINGARVSDFSHIFAIVGGTLLIITSTISPDWLTHPKINILQLAIAGLLFSATHIGCYNTLDHLNHSWSTSHREWYLLVWFSRTWFRMIQLFVVPSDLMVLWVKGLQSSKKIFPITSVIALVVAVASTIGFAVAGTETKGLYPCWYRYGPDQINYDLFLLFAQLICGILVLAVTSCVLPATYESCNENQELENSMSEVAANSTSQPRSFVSNAAFDIDNADDVELDETPSVTLTNDKNEGIGSKEEIDEALKMKDAVKCSVTGGYVFRTKLLLGVSVASTIFQILGNRTALAGMEDAEAILKFLQIVNIFITDGMCFIVFLTYINMRKTGWVKLGTRLRIYMRSCLILNLIKGEGPQQDVSFVPVMWKRLANNIASARIIKNRRRRMKMYEKCVPGKELLKYLIEEKIATTYDEAISMCNTLFEFDLLHHVTFDYSASDIDSNLLFCVVATSVPRITAEERSAVRQSRRWSASNPPLILPPPPISQETTVKHRSSSKEVQLTSTTN
jgi:predicted permease